MVVVAKYKEDVSWVKQLNYEYKIYDKSLDIPNVGREAETYLRFIIENYDGLPDYTVFLQGNPFDHSKIANVDFINKSIESAGDSVIFLNTLYPEDHNAFTRTRESFIALFHCPIPPTFLFSPGAQFIVPRKNILCRPKEFYETISKVMVENNEKTYTHKNCLVCPWTIERMWMYIFDDKIKHKNITELNLN
jgi:hypothetical protein